MHGYVNYFAVKFLVTEDELSKKILKQDPIKKDNIDTYIKNTNVLLITANPTEYNAVLYFLKGRNNDNPQLYSHPFKIGFISKTVTYVFGEFAGHNVAVHQMGYQGPAAAQSVIVEAAQCFGESLCKIISVGIACGVNKKVKLLDVLVAKKLTSYTEGRISSTKNSSFVLLPRSEGHKKLTVKEQLESYLPEQWLAQNSETAKRLLEPPAIYPKEILSGNYLIDSITAKEILINEFSKEAIGIEMEGAGLFHDNDCHNNITKILIKGVSDFGDGKKGKRFQPTAALLAAECVHHYLKMIGNFGVP